MICRGEMPEWNGQMGPWWSRLPSSPAGRGGDFLALSAILACLMLFAGQRMKRRLPALLALLLVGGQIACAWAARGVFFGTFPWGIDHPSFMFRLHEFRAVFPSALGGYNPWWNAGTEHFVGVTSGAHNFSVLVAPLLAFWEPHVFYGPALFFWFFVGFPWLGALSMRSAGVRWSGAFGAGLLMLAATRATFLFSWQSGNVGAMTSSMLVLPVVALGYRLAVLRRGGWPTAAALAVATWLMCLWSPGVFIGAALFLGWLWNRRRWTWRANRRVFAAGALALALLLPWFWVTWFPSRAIVDYVGAGAAGAPWLESAQVALRQFARRLGEWHPLLLGLGLAGTAFAAPRSVRRWTLPVLLAAGAVVASIGWKRQSQLDRMAIPMAVAAAFPAAVLCGRLFAERTGSSRRRRVVVAAAQGVALAALATGARVAVLHAGGAGGFKLWSAPTTLLEFADWIRREVPEEGRLAFAGTTDWKYDWGKPAYLPILTGREMMADDYYDFPKPLIARNYPPRAYRASTEAFLAFTRAHGITHWAAADAKFRGFFDSDPAHFERVHEVAMTSNPRSPAWIYRVVGEPAPSRFLEGAGCVAARENRIEVSPADPAADRVVIRYRWRDGLRCRTPGASIEPHEVDGQIRFIAVRPGGNARVVLGYRPGWAPTQPDETGVFHH